MATAASNPTNVLSTGVKLGLGRRVQKNKKQQKKKGRKGVNNNELAEVKRQLAALKLSIPRPTKKIGSVNMLMEFLLTQPGVFKLMTMVLCPNRRNAIRWPDDSGLPTALYCSTREFIVQASVGTDLGANSGKFTICTQPKLGVIVGASGLTTDFSNWNVLFANGDVWPSQVAGAVQVTPITYSNMYDTFINGDTASADPELDHLIGDQVGYARFASVLTGETHPIPFGDGVVASNTNTILNARGAPQYSITNQAAIPTSSWQVPVGIWSLTLTFITTGAVGAFNPTGTAQFGAQFAAGSTNVAVAMTNQLTSNFTGGAYSGIITCWLLNVNDPKTATLWTPLLNVSTFQAANVSEVTATWIPTVNAETTTTFANWPYLPAGRLLENVRPVAHSLLFTCELSSLDNAGDIAALSFGPEVLQNQYLVDKPEEPGPMQESATLGNYQGAYEGKVAKGAYTYWVHADETQLEFKSYKDANATDYGGTCISGIVKPNTIPTGATTINIGRAIATTIYEFETTSRIPETRSSQTTVMALNIVKEMTKGQPMATQNDIHEWFTNQVAKGNKLAQRILPYIKAGLQIAEVAGAVAAA